jgi:hypothetical protein
MGSVPKCEIAIDYEYDRFTHPLPRTVPTVSKRHVLTFEAKPNETDDSQWHPHCLKSRVSSIPPLRLPLRINSDEVCSAKIPILADDVHKGPSVVG